MREKLGKEEGARKTFTAIFSKVGKKVNYNGYSEDTILLKDVKDAVSGEVLADHVWFAYSKAFEKVTLVEGMTIEFEARIKSYKKGYVNKAARINWRKNDFKLSHPTKVKIILQ